MMLLFRMLGLPLLLLIIDAAVQNVGPPIPTVIYDAVVQNLGLWPLLFIYYVVQN